MPLTAKVSPTQQSAGYSVTDSKGNRGPAGRVDEVRIDPHPQGGVTLRRLVNGADVHTTRHQNVDEAKHTAQQDLAIADSAWSGTLGP